MPNQLDTDILPASSDTYNLGSALQRYKNLFVQTLRNVSQLFSGATSGTTTLQASAIASGTLTLPAATDTLVGKATTDTLTNKTLTSPAITGTISGTPGIVGVTDASSATAGNIGQLLSGQQTVSQSLTTATILNLTSVPLTAGDWDVSATASFGVSVGATYIRASISTVNNAVGLAYDGSTTLIQATAATISTSGVSTGVIRVSISGSATYYLNLDAAFASGTVTATGTIRARRVR